jgi:receptor expression-enhancing protein 5/6
VNGFLGKFPQVDQPLSQLSEKIKVDKAFIAVGIALVPILLSVVLGFGHFVVDLVGFAYPLYASVKAIETQSKDDDTQWLTYWIIFGFFKIFEGIAEPLVSIIPFYFLGQGCLPSISS